MRKEIEERIKDSLSEGLIVAYEFLADKQTIVLTARNSEGELIENLGSISTL